MSTTKFDVRKVVEKNKNGEFVPSVSKKETEKEKETSKTKKFDVRKAVEKTENGKYTPSLRGGTPEQTTSAVNTTTDNFDAERNKRKEELLKKREELEKSKTNFGDLALNFIAGPFGTENMQQRADSYLSGYNKNIDAEIADIDKQIAELDGVNYEKKASGWDIAYNTFGSGMSTWNKQIASTLDAVLPTERLGEYDYVSKLNDYYSNQDKLWKQQKANSLKGRSGAVKVMSDIGEGAAAALPNALLALASLGTSAVGTTLGTTTSSGTGVVSALKNMATSAVKNPMYWTSVAQTLGTDYEEAKADGANDFIASATAIIKSAINAGVEIGGGIETLPSNLKGGNTSVIKEWIKSMIDEGKEEVIQGIVSNSVDMIMYDYNKDVISLENEEAVINPSRMAKEFGMGAAVGGVLGGGQTGIVVGANAIANLKNGRQQIQESSIDEEPTTEPDTLEKAAIDVVANRNAQEGENKAETAVTSEGGTTISPEDEKWYISAREAAQPVINDIESGMSAQDLRKKSYDALIEQEEARKGASGRQLTEEEIQKLDMLYKRYYYYQMASKNPQEALKNMKSVSAKAEQISESKANSNVVGKGGTIPTPKTTTPETAVKTASGTSLSIEEAKKISGYGENGAKVFINAVNNANGKNPIDIKLDMNVAYMAGYSNQDINIDSDLKQEAYFAGKADRTMDDMAAKEKAKNATVYGKNRGVIKNEYYKKLSPAEQEMFSVFAEDFGESAEVVNEIVAAVIDGKERRASGSHLDGKVTGSATTTKPVFKWIMHENGHRMEQLATDEWNILSDALYARAERLGRRAAMGVSQGMAFDRVKSEHDNAGMSMSTRGYVGEVVMRELETIFSSAEEFNAWRAELDAQPQVKSAWAKFMDWLTETLERIKWTIANRKLSPEARAAARAEIAEIEHIKGLLGNAYKATRTVVAERTAEMERANAENNNVNSDTSTRDNIDNSPETEEATKKTPEKTSEENTKGKEYKHLYNEETVSKEFLSSVNPEIENAILNIRNGNSETIPDVIEVAKLSDATVKVISDFVGFDVSGYVCKIEKDALLHIERRHGIKGKHDQSLGDPKDTARIGYVINNIDHIEWSTEENGDITLSKKYNNKDNSLSPVMLISTKIDGTYCVSQVVPDTKRKTIWVSSARIEKADVGNQVPNGNNVTPQRTPETPLDSSSANGILSQKMENVKTVTLKHTKNLYSLFKGTPRVVVGKDVILAGDVAVPLTDNALAEVKKVVDENKIEMGNTAATFAKIAANDNDVVISGNPKVAEAVTKGKKASVYVFKVGSDYYICEQKYLDAFNNGENIIKANKDKRKVWTVHDKDNNIVGVFMPAVKTTITDAEYDKLQSVNDVLEANKAKKATQKNASFNSAETKFLCSQPKLMTFDINGNTFITEGHFALKVDNSAIDYIKEQYETNSNGEVMPADIGKRIEEFIKRDVVGEVSQTVSDDITETDRNGRTKVKHRRTACIVGDMAFLFDTKYYNMVSKRSSTMKILSGGDVTTTLVVGYDSNGEFVGLVLPIRPTDESYVEVDGKQIPYTHKIKKESSPKSTTKEKAPKPDKATPKKVKTKVVETTAKLDDFGEKIGGARKDQWNSRGLLVDDLDNMNERERDKNVKKDNVWKRPNYRALVEAGEDRGILWAVNEIRKSLSQNVYYGYNATAETKAEKQKLFVETIRAIQTMAESAKTQADFEAMGEKWLIDNGYLEDTGRNYSRYVYTKKYSNNPALAGSNYLNNIRYLAKNFNSLTALADRNQFAVDTKSVVPKGFSIVGGEGSVGSKLVNGEWVKDTSYSVAKGSFIIKSGFATKEEALEWLKQGIAKKKGKTRFVPQQLLEVHRKGADYRNSKSVDGRRYIDTFGFKGGEFGNWMNAKDRQVSLDYGYDALKDLADALNIDDTDISFGGNLNIAFGARGQGLSGAAAHYENERRVINLTKMNGAGSLAHEWFHALDDFIGGYKSEYATNTPRNLPERTQKAIRDLITAMRYKDATQEETDLARQHAYDRAVKNVTYQIKNQFGWVEKFENGTLTEGEMKYFKRTPTQDDVDKYHVLLTALLETGETKYIEELSNLRKEVRGHVISKEERDSLSFRLYALKPSAKEGVQLSRKSTDFFNNSVKFGQLHSKDGDYWDSTVEMSARAFACYVADKTNKQNDYLSAHSDSAITFDIDRNGNPVVVRAYPVGEERTAINNAFDNLIEALKEDGFLHEREQTEKPPETRYSLEDSFSTEGMTESDIENASSVIKDLKTRAISSKYVDGFASYTAERMEREIKNSSSRDVLDYAKSYITWVDPIDFVYATTTSEQYRNQLKEEAGILDIEKLQSEEQPIHLTVNFETGEIVGHEGRHRMLALQGKGIDKVAVIIDALNDNRHHTKPIDFMALTGQSFAEYRKGTDMYLHDMLPLSQRYADTARELFTNKPKSEVQFSFDDVEEVSSKKTQGFLDAVEDMKNGKRNAANKLSKYVDSGMISTKDYDDLIEKYGFIPYGENPSRDIQVPKKTAKDKKVSQTVRTILEAKVTPDEAVPTIKKMVEDGIFSYDVYSDKKAINDAEDYLNEYGWTESLDDWFEDIEKGVVSKQHTAMGWALYNNAANTAATTTSETERKTAIQTSLNILDAMIKHQRNAAQALQATRILKKLSPETQLYGVQKSVSAFQKELTDKYGDKAPNLKIDEELAEQYLEAETQEEREAVEKEIFKDIGRQMPSRFIDKWNAWRYLAMLGNLRTHGRNILGNAGFAPIVAAKNLTATTIESIVHRISGGKTIKNKAIITASKADKALLKAAWGDYAIVADLITNGGKYNDSATANQYIEKGRRIFKNKVLEAARKGNSKLLDIEDMWFAQPHYAYALAQYCKAHNITAEQISRGKAIEPARTYAIKEAQKATYRDTNAFSQMVSSWGRSSNENDNATKKAFNTVIEGILPFRKTPANLLVRGAEYSPLGLLKGLSYDLVQVAKGKKTAAEAIDNISAGLTGTGLVALGVWLAAEGLVRGYGEDEEKEKKFKELMGHQGYAIELPNGQSITLDWLAPEALPFFVGVNLWETTKGTGEETNLSDILKAVSNISEPMLEMSCLQSLNDLFESVGYASSNDTSGLISVLSSAATSYLTQGIPTLFGQIERTGEENRMTTYTEKNGFLTGDMQYTLGRASAKIPFWDYQQIPYIDAWGRKEASGTALKRGLNNFLNPAYTSTIEESNMEKELLRLYEKTGEGSVFPERADKYFTVDGQRKDLTADEYVRYATLKGEKSYKLISDLVKSKAYKKLDDNEKAKAIAEAYDYANQKAKKAISNYKTDSWVSTADSFGSSVGNYLSFRADVSDTRADNGGKISKQEVIDIITDMAQNDPETWRMYLSMYDSTGDHYAHDNGIKGGTYMDFVEALDKADKPTESGKYGTYTQEEAEQAIRNMRGLSQREKAILWQSVNSQWKAKNNPFR